MICGRKSVLSMFILTYLKFWWIRIRIPVLPQLSFYLVVLCAFKAIISAILLSALVIISILLSALCGSSAICYPDWVSAILDWVSGKQVARRPPYLLISANSRQLSKLTRKSDRVINTLQSQKEICKNRNFSENEH